MSQHNVLERFHQRIILSAHRSTVMSMHGLIFDHIILTMKIIKSSLYPKYSQSVCLIIIMILITFATWRTDASCASCSKQYSSTTHYYIGMVWRYSTWNAI